jgi:UDPglucose 6-dehydrogenase
MKIDKVSLIGLGKLGLPLLATFANNNVKIIGVDIDQEKIDKLKNKDIPFYEPNLENYLINGYDNIEVTSDFKKALNETDIYIILVNTPSDNKGEFSNKYIYDAIDKLFENNTNDEDFLIVMSSTVMPGSHSDIIKRIETLTNKKLNNGFGYVYIPDLVALGCVIKDFENPDVMIVGQSNDYYGDIAINLYNNIIKNEAPVVRMSIIEGELTKVSLNAYITMKISFANFIGNLSDKFNCNPNNITKALGYDKRISPYYIKSGVSFGGTCFPRDTWAFIKVSENVGLNATHIKATQTINDQQNDILYNKLSIHKGKKIGVLGLSFKPDTTVTTESAGQFLLDKLKENNYDVVGYDPLVPTNYSDIINFVNYCDVIAIIHNNQKMIDGVDFTNKIIINPWNLKIR